MACALGFCPPLAGPISAHRSSLPAPDHAPSASCRAAASSALGSDLSARSALGSVAALSGMPGAKQRHGGRRVWRCEAGSSSAEERQSSIPSTSGAEEKPASPLPSQPTKATNRALAAATCGLAIGLFMATRTASAGPDLRSLSAGAVPYDEALSNGLPTVVEFYADWCEVCREMAKDVYKLEQAYKGKVNFVLLNIDNLKWAEEVDEYGVGGIPHFVFLDNSGREEGSAVGKLPASVLNENLEAMARGDRLLPHSRATGKTSGLESRPVQAPPLVDPRSHG